MLIDAVEGSSMSKEKKTVMYSAAQQKAISAMSAMVIEKGQEMV